MNKKKSNTTPQQIRKKIINQVQIFQELSREVEFLPFAGCRLKDIIGSKSLWSIKQKTHLILSKWGKDYENVEEMLKMTESLRKNYVNLIFRTNFIQNPEVRVILDEIPLALGEIIKEYKS